MIDPGSLSTTLAASADGIWRAAVGQPISYPESGNADCYALENDSFWFQHRNRIIATLVERFRPAGIFADIGGGNGFVSCALEANRQSCFLIEPGARGVENARKRGLKHVVHGTFEQCGFQAGAFGAAGLFDVVEHIAEPEPLLREVHRCLMARGKLFISVPAYQYLWSEDDRYAGHQRRYTVKSLSSLLAPLGFQTVFSSYFFRPLWLPLLLIRTLPSRAGFRRRQTAEQSVQEHRPPRGVMGRVLAQLLDREYQSIRTGKPVAYGTSVVVVAEKIGAA